MSSESDYSPSSHLLSGHERICALKLRGVIILRQVRVVDKRFKGQITVVSNIGRGSIRATLESGRARRCTSGSKKED